MEQHTEPQPPLQLTSQDVLQEILREGARRLLREAIEAEIQEYVSAHTDQKDSDGRRLVVRNDRGGQRSLDVKAAAALAGVSATMREKSGRPLALTPALMAPKRNPRGMMNRERSVMCVIGLAHLILQVDEGWCAGLTERSLRD